MPALSVKPELVRIGTNSDRIALVFLLRFSPPILANANPAIPRKKVATTNFKVCFEILVWIDLITGTKVVKNIAKILTVYHKF